MRFELVIWRPTLATPDLFVKFSIRQWESLGNSSAWVSNITCMILNIIVHEEGSGAGGTLGLETNTAA